MDSREEPPAKRQKIASSTFLNLIPGELRNAMYKMAIIPEDAKLQSRTVKTISKNSTISPEETICSFFVDIVDASGRSWLFKNDLVRVSEITQETLSLITPKILFKTISTTALEMFVEIFTSHTSVCENIPELHIEVNLMDGLDQSDIRTLDLWEETKLPHGRNTKVENNVKKWLSQIQLLPQATTVHLVFVHMWRDWRELRGLSKKFGLSRRKVTFQFPPPSIAYDEHTFCVAQTIAAVADIEVSEQAGISLARRQELVKSGCRGFNRVQKRSDI
ncbi:hypothetical protein V496_05215 [Pseudogymnoascus sp. VKM F-4515 (FW-2607)]|nr:hypothetical protein V496_05215 [Pseudogymnoascus sp. VKM F-4515 (FW-2607)]